MNSNSCNILAKKIWTSCTDRIVWLSAIHIPGKGNNSADYMPRLLSENTKLKLFPTIFKNLVTNFTSNHIINILASCFC